MDTKKIFTRIQPRISDMVYDKDDLSYAISFLYIQFWRYANGWSESRPDDAVVKLKHLALDYKNMPPDLLNGSIGLVWLLSRLANEGIIDSPPNIMQIANHAITRHTSYIGNAPVALDLNNRLYPLGIGLCELLDESDSIERYSLQELLIFHLCDCEKALTSTIPHIYSHTSISSGILHSIIAFADIATKRGIYPYMARKVKKLATNAIPNTEQSLAIDNVILDLIKGNNPSATFIGAPIRQWLHLLSEAGLLSMIYRKPELFKAALTAFSKATGVEADNCDLLLSLPDNLLAGIIMGLINILDNEN